MGKIAKESLGPGVKRAKWMKNGAQPTDTVRILLKKSGAIEG